MVSLGALTTTFVPPNSCIASFSTDFKIVGFDVMGPVSTDGCFPPNYDFATDAYYSPGFCPAGYTAGCMTPLPAKGLVASETTVTCCPTSYSCQPSPYNLQGSTYLCVSRIVTFIGEQLTLSGSQTVATIPTVTVTPNDNWIANAFGIQVRYQSTDFVSPITASSSSSGHQTLSSSPDGTSPAQSTSISTASPSGGLSTGAAAGIGVGATLGFLMLVGLVILVGCRNRRNGRVIRSGVGEQAQPLELGGKLVVSELQ